MSDAAPVNKERDREQGVGLRNVQRMRDCRSKQFVACWILFDKNEYTSKTIRCAWYPTNYVCYDTRPTTAMDVSAQHPDVGVTYFVPIGWCMQAFVYNYIPMRCLTSGPS